MNKLLSKLFYLIALIAFLFDRITKILVYNNMHPSQSFPLIPNILHLTYVQNRGAAFGLLFGYSSLLILIGIIIVFVIFYFHHCIPKNLFITQFALGSILGGSLGNIFDRITLGYVIDFIDIRVWPVFNLADIVINFGVFLLIYHFFRSNSCVSNSN